MAPPPGVSWAEHYQTLSSKYPTPSDAPDLPLLPGTSSLPATWKEWAQGWRKHYDSLPAEAVPSSLPPPGSSGDAWDSFVSKSK